jgi:PAS domain S-box-containing protein
LQKASNKLYMAYRYSAILLESMSDGLISTDNNGIVTEINARGGEIFGISPAVAKGRHISEIAHLQPVLPPLLGSGADHESRDLIVDRTGRKVSASTSLLRDEVGGVIGAVAVLREIGRRPAANPLALEAHNYRVEDMIGDGPAMVRAEAMGEAGGKLSFHGSDLWRNRYWQGIAGPGDSQHR